MRLIEWNAFLRNTTRSCSGSVTICRTLHRSKRLHTYSNAGRQRKFPHRDLTIADGPHVHHDLFVAQNAAIPPDHSATLAGGCAYNGESDTEDSMKSAAEFRGKGGCAEKEAYVRGTGTNGFGKVWGEPIAQF